MIEQRVHELERQVSDLREDNGSQNTTLEHLSQQVTALSKAVTELTTTLDRSRGALWVIGGIASIVGVLAHIASEHFLSKP